MFCLKNNYAYQAMLFPSRSRNTLRWFCLMNNSAQNNHPLFFLFFAGDANGCVYAPASEKSQSSKLQSGVHFYCRAYASLQLFLPLDTHTVYRVDPPMRFWRAGCFWRCNDGCRYNCHLSSIHLSACLPWILLLMSLLQSPTAPLATSPQSLKI